MKPERQNAFWDVRGRWLIAALAVSIISAPLIFRLMVDAPARPDWNQTYATLPMSFEPNLGQTDRAVRFTSRATGYRLFLTAAEAVMVLSERKEPVDGPPRGDLVEPQAQSTAVRMRFEGANQNPKVTGEDALPGKSHYLIGNDPAQWRTNVPTYARVRYDDVYPGIDLVYYGNGQELEFDFLVAPGANPGAIRMEFGETSRPSLNRKGELTLRETGEAVLTLRKPEVYQLVNAERRIVQTEYVLLADQTVGFRVGDYDARETLVIDPTVSYLSAVGGFSNDIANGIAVDGAGNAYITGYTDSLNFPAVNAVQPAKSDNFDVFVAALNPTGSALVYSTYLGGTGWDTSSAIAVDSSGNAYLTGFSASTDFPTANALQPSRAGSSYDAFVVKLTAGGALSYSTYLGGNSVDWGRGIAVDGAGNAFVTGDTNSTDFPLVNPAQANYGQGGDVFVSKLNAAGSALVYSTFLGGSLTDAGRSIAIDAAGNAYVAGSTTSLNFPTTNPVQAVHGGGFFVEDAFVAKLNAAGSAFTYATYLGGSADDLAMGIGVGSDGSAYVTGRTRSTNFPTASPLQSGHGGSMWDGFVAKLNPAGSSLAYSTYLGGTADDQAYGIGIDGAGNALVTGATQSTNFPMANPAQPFHAGNWDIFLSKLNESGSALSYSTFLGSFYEDLGFGVAVDVSGSAYVTGYSLGAFFHMPVAVLGSRTNLTAVVAKIAFGNTIPVANIIAPLTGSAGGTVSAVIVGRHLSDASAVTFSGTGVTATIGSGGTDTSLPITITIAPTAELTMRTVTVTGSGGPSNSLPGFTVSPPSLWTWNYAGKPFWSTNVNGIEIDPGNDAQWYVGTSAGLFITRDSGNTWQHALAGLHIVSEAVAIDPSNLNRLYVGAGAKLYRSTDRGLSWTLMNSFPVTSSGGIGSLTVDATDGRVYVPYPADPSANDHNPGVYTSDDLGVTWDFHSYGYPENFLIHWDIAQHPVTGALFVVTEIADHPGPVYNPPLFRSLDKGVTWEEVSGNAIAWHATKIQANPANQDVFVLQEGPGLYRTSNSGLTWQYMSNAFWLGFVLDSAHPSRQYGGGHILAGGGAFLSTDSGLNFTPIGLTGLMVPHLALNNSGTRLYAIVYETGIFVADVVGLPPRRRSGQITSQ